MQAGTFCELTVMAHVLHNYDLLCKSFNSTDTPNDTVPLDVNVKSEKESYDDLGSDTKFQDTSKRSRSLLVGVSPKLVSKHEDVIDMIRGELQAAQQMIKTRLEPNEEDNSTKMDTDHEDTSPQRVWAACCGDFQLWGPALQETLCGKLKEVLPLAGQMHVLKSVDGAIISQGRDLLYSVAAEAFLEEPTNVQIRHLFKQNKIHHTHKFLRVTTLSLVEGFVRSVVKEPVKLSKSEFTKYNRRLARKVLPTHVKIITYNNDAVAVPMTPERYATAHKILHNIKQSTRDNDFMEATRMHVFQDAMISVALEMLTRFEDPVRIDNDSEECTSEQDEWVERKFQYVMEMANEISLLASRTRTRQYRTGTIAWQTFLKAIEKHTVPEVKYALKCYVCASFTLSELGRLNSNGRAFDDIYEARGVANVKRTIKTHPKADLDLIQSMACVSMLLQNVSQSKDSNMDISSRETTNKRRKKLTDCTCKVYSKLVHLMREFKAASACRTDTVEVAKRERITQNYKDALPRSFW